MGSISLQIPVVGGANSVEDPKLASDMTTLQTAINGQLDDTNLTAAFDLSAGVNTSGQTVKGAVNIAASEARTNTAYGLLTTPDQVSVTLPTNGLISVWYQATWQESVAGAGRAAIFIGSNQLKLMAGFGGGTGVQTTAARTGSTGTNTNRNLFGFTGGLASTVAAYDADVSTGQAVGYGAITSAGTTLASAAYDVAGNLTYLPSTDSDYAIAALGGPCYIFAAAGTYAVSVQFRATSGSVTASSRKLWVKAESFA